MTSPIRKLALAAVLAASLPAAALAHEHDEDCDHRAPPPAAYVPPPAYGPAVVAYPDPPAPYVREGHGRWWRERAWREREIAHLRFELHQLDVRRAEAYARFGGNPWRMARFDRWYGWRRAELERRLDELQPVAWR